jgi:hypothetical protein
MGDKDTVTKEYMQDSAVFADAFNFLLYDGEQIIKPEQLKPVDTTAIVLPYGENDQAVPIQKYRDILKSVTVMQDGNAAYMLLGIENQSQIHYAMPVRNMLYDAMQYVSQVEDASRSHRNGEAKPETSAEYLSGFYRTDKLLPVITLTLYFGAEQWVAPTDLYGMLSANDDILRFVDNYHLHLIAPAQISDEEFDKFHTELRLALKYVKNSMNKKRLRELVHEEEAYRHVSRKTADLLNIVTGSDLQYNEGEENVDMCLAIEEMRKDAMVEGLARGMAQGMEKGIQKGIEEGLEKGIEEGLEKGMEKGKEEGIISTLVSLVKKGILTLAQAAEEANMTVSEFEAKTGLNA